MDIIPTAGIAFFFRKETGDVLVGNSPSEHHAEIVHANSTAFGVEAAKFWKRFRNDSDAHDGLMDFYYGETGASLRDGIREAGWCAGGIFADGSKVDVPGFDKTAVELIIVL